MPRSRERERVDNSLLCKYTIDIIDVSKKSTTVLFEIFGYQCLAFRQPKCVNIWIDFWCHFVWGRSLSINQLNSTFFLTGYKTFNDNSISWLRNKNNNAEPNNSLSVKNKGMENVIVIKISKPYRLKSAKWYTPMPFVEYIWGSRKITCLCATPSKSLSFTRLFTMLAFLFWPHILFTG